MDIDIDLFMRMLSIDSTSSKERGFADFLEKEFGSGKCTVSRFEVGDGTVNLLLSWGVFDGLTADLLQMSHHGQNGVTREVYERIAPKACIWPSPSWLYECQVGNREGFLTYETKAWIEEMGIKENYCIKDGDVTIR